MIGNVFRSCLPAGARCIRAMAGALLLALGAGAPETAAAQPAAEPSYVDVWGPAVGSELPLLEATDQTGRTRTLDNLAGSQGLLLFLNRSADW